MSDDIAASDLSDVFSNAVWALVRNYITIEGTIQAVYPDTLQADVNVDGAVFMKCPYNLLIDGSPTSDVEDPKVGTDCHMGFLDGSLQRPIVLRAREGTKRSFAYDLTQFNGGQNGGMVLLLQLVAKLNNIENLLNQFIALYNSHTHPVSGSATGVPVVPEDNTLTPTQRADIENTKILQ